MKTLTLEIPTRNWLLRPKSEKRSNITSQVTLAQERDLKQFSYVSNEGGLLQRKLTSLFPPNPWALIYSLLKGRDGETQQEMLVRNQTRLTDTFGFGGGVPIWYRAEKLSSTWDKVSCYYKFCTCFWTEGKILKSALHGTESIRQLSVTKCNTNICLHHVDWGCDWVCGTSQRSRLEILGWNRNYHNNNSPFLQYLVTNGTEPPFCNPVYFSVSFFVKGYPYREEKSNYLMS